MFADRADAGRKLAKAMQGMHFENPLVLAIPRGGVITGIELAKSLDADLDIVVPRKLAAPNEPEVAIGAIMADGTTAINEGMVSALNITEAYLTEEKNRQIEECKRRLAAYRGSRPYPKIKGRSVIVVDDGVATGATLLVSLKWLWTLEVARTVVAIPVAPATALIPIRAEADDVVCLEAPSEFYAVGLFYDDFKSVPDAEVISLLGDYWSARSKH